MDGFANCFRAVTGHERLEWQRRLFDHLVAGEIPSSLILSTGLGKTSIISIWLIALALQRPDVRRKLPRRLVYVVNRRTVVDQATESARGLLGRVYRSGERDGLPWATAKEISDRGLQGEPPLCGSDAKAVGELRERLAAHSGSDGAVPLAVSTLRGELADNEAWKVNPARPAIIIGTIDMIGSKLLFSGYGDGRYGRAHHAGLIGQDALIVHDEAHLSPAFDELLRSVAAEQTRSREARPIRVMSLSATTRSVSTGGTDHRAPFVLEPHDLRDPVVSQRVHARKTLKFVEVETAKFVAAIAKEALSLGASPARVLVYVRSLEHVTKIAAEIEKGLASGCESCIATLTGTIRGKERDELASGEVFRSFKSASDRSSALPHTLYLISTSAGEVGADLDADHLVCDLTTLDSMAQRFGRVNRLGGEARSAAITVVAEPIGDKVSLKSQIEETAKLLHKLPLVEDGYDASPAALSALLAKPEAQAAFSPVPSILPATDILFDHWALTSIAGEVPGRPEVGDYLHGVADWEPPETHVAWRADIALLAEAGGKDQTGKDQPCSPADIEAVFDAFPLRSAEQLRDRTDRVQAELWKIAERLRKNAENRVSSPPANTTGAEDSNSTGDENEGEDRTPEAKDKPIEPNPWVVLMRGGSVKWVQLEEIAPADKDDSKRVQRSLSFATVVLPLEVGGLKDGMLDGSVPAPKGAMALDVAELTVGGMRDRQRVLVSGDDGGESLLLPGKIANGRAGFVARHAVTLAGRNDEDTSQVIEYRLAKGQDREPGERIGLSAHAAAVAAAGERIAKALRLDDPAVRAIALAGRWHDAGKARSSWQRFANNIPQRDKPGGPIAKSDRYGHWKQLAGYRHEFGSLHDALADDELRRLDADTCDLVLHLIAAHHGWARPHFEPRHFDGGDPGKPRPTIDNERLVVETMQRFARLQQCYGRWGLAWLESVLRCADAEASESPTPAEVSAGTASERERKSGGAA